MTQDQQASNNTKSMPTSFSWKRFSGAIKLIAAIILGITALVCLLAAFIAVVNADLGGRSTTTEAVDGWPGFPHNSGTPNMTVYLVIHRLVEGENQVEVSTVFAIDEAEARKLTRDNIKNLTVSVIDGSPIRPGVFEYTTSVPLDVNASNRVTIESPPFRLPVLSSVFGFPFDDDEIYVAVYVTGSNAISYDFHLEVEKGFPGRTLSVEVGKGGTPHIVLSRSPLAKILVVTCATMFLLICVLVALWLVSDKSSLTGLEAVFAVAGFLIACGEFRGILTAQEVGDTSAFEIGAWLVPMFLLSVVFCVVTFRERLKARQDVAQHHLQAG